jgi:KDO2-lipid IV(A) lauroyltransferase
MRTPPVSPSLTQSLRVAVLWVATLTLRVVSRLPFSWLLYLGRVMGRLLRRLMRYRRGVARRNLELCFPQLDPGQREALLRAHFEALGMGIVEVALAWWATQRRIARLVRVEGLEHLEGVLAQGRGAYLLGAHFTSVELSGRLLASSGVPLCVTYREQKHPALDRLVRRWRDAIYTQTVPRRDTRQMIRILRDGGVIWVASDQDLGRHHSVFAEFFGVAAATVPGASRLARISGARVLPAWCERLPGTQGYVVWIEPPLAAFPSDDVLADTRRTNAAIEGMVRRAPEQYLWIHRRFKTRPEGQSRLYPQKPRRVRRHRLQHRRR